MNQIEFGKRCRELNKIYHSIFGTIPSSSDYMAPREKYLEALQKAIDEKIPLENILEKKRRETPFLI